MPKDLQIGSNIYIYPSPGEPAGWSEGASDWADGVTNALKTVQGPNDIPIRSHSVVLNEGLSGDVGGLIFDSSTVQAIDVKFIVTRTYSNPSIPTEVESGDIMGNITPDGEFSISVSSIGDAGVTFSAVSQSNTEGLTPGQIRYTYEERSDTQNIQIKFKAKTIDQLGNG